MATISSSRWKTIFVLVVEIMTTRRNKNEKKTGSRSFLANPALAYRSLKIAPASAKNVSAVPVPVLRLTSASDVIIVLSVPSLVLNMTSSAHVTFVRPVPVAVLVVTPACHVRIVVPVMDRLAIALTSAVPVIPLDALTSVAERVASATTGTRSTTAEVSAVVVVSIGHQWPIVAIE
jgi:hypothetical protein